MKYREFGKTGIEISEVGLGTWQFGADWGGMDEKTAHAIMSAAVDNGVRFFDTADIYGQGLSEKYIGNFLKGCSEKIVVATKMARSPNPGWPKNFRLFNFKQFIEGSLERLQVDRIDLMQIHSIPFDFIKKPELWEWITILKKEGKVKHFGLSVETVEEMLFCLEKEDAASLQIIFNIFRQKPAELVFEKAKAKEIGLIARLPMASGLLTGKFTAKTTFKESDHRTYNRDGQAFNVGETFAGIPFEKGVELANELKKFVPKGMTLAQMALRWILDHDAVSVIIPGATSPKQAQENAAVSNLPPLSKELHEQLKEFYSKEVIFHIRGKY